MSIANTWGLICRKATKREYNSFKVRRSTTRLFLLAAGGAPLRRTAMAKASAITETVWKGPVYIVPLGWGLTATFVVLFILCFLAALLFPNAELTHNWLSLYSTRPMGSAGQLIEGVIWNVVFAWIAAVIFGLVYNWLAPKA
jgi:hypothetical protein